MSKKTLYLGWLLVSIFSYSINLSAQISSSDDLEFKNALDNYITDQLIEVGEDAIAQERFLIEQMRIVNFEIKSRIHNIDEIRGKYFNGLEGRLHELRALKDRIGPNSSASLTTFIDKLERRIEQTIDEGEINYSRQKVFEDGLQLLYIAEEMLNLDPGSRLGGDQNITQKIENSQEQLMESFGETSAGSKDVTFSSITSSEDATIFNLFKEWKRNNTLNYKLRWTDVQIIKRDLLKNSTALQKEAMFKRELESALNAYNFGHLDLADRLFSEILNTYTFISTKDDIYYYKAEANYILGRYLLAEKFYQKLVDEFPTSSLVTSSYARLVKIADHFNDYDKVANYLQNFKSVATSSDPVYSEIHFIAGVSAVANGAYEDAVNYLNEINLNSEFYPDGRYLIAQAYSGAGNLDEAEQILLNLVKDFSLPPDYYFNVQLKLGYINYEKGNYFQALKYFDQISGNFALYDRVLIGYGWAYYKAELQKEVADSMDFSYAKKYLELLINYFDTSDYYLEANSLLGFIYQKEQIPEKAIRQFDYVFRSRKTKDISDKFIDEEEKVKNSLTQIEAEKNDAIFRNDLFAFTEANRRYQSLEDSLLRLKYSAISSNSIAAKNEIQRMHEQIRELDKLKEVAQARNNRSLVNKIESLQNHLRDTINDFPHSGGDSSFGVNYYDDYPSARKESILEDNNNKIVSMRDEALKQRANLQAELDKIYPEIESARGAKNYKHMIFLEVKADKLKKMIQEYDYLYALAYELGLSDSQINLQRWSDYGAFGIANVNYAVKQDKLKKRSYYLDQIDLINKLLNSRKNLLDHKINLVEGEINYMTRKVRRQERLRERAELDRKFEESYFDTHTSETQEESQPVINQENQEE